MGDEFFIADPAANGSGMDVEEIGDFCDRVELLGGGGVDGAHGLRFPIQRKCAVRCCLGC